MTNRSADQTAARSLASLSGAPYQSCLTAVSVLRTLPDAVNLGLLDDILQNHRRPIALALLAEERDITDLHRLLAPAGAWTAPGDAVLWTNEYDGTNLLFPIEPPGLAIPANVSLYIDVNLDTRTRRGVYQCSTTDLLRATELALDRPSLAGTIEICAWPPSQTPDLPRAIDDTYLSDRLRTVSADTTTPGPGFQWSLLAFSTLGLEHEGDPDHRLVDCTDNHCGWLHDWPTADVNRQHLVLPDVLLAAWQQYAATMNEPVDHESMSHRFDGGTSEPSWYGVDLPTYDTLWARVDPHPEELAAPWA